jgi:hypothetical protein
MLGPDTEGCLVAVVRFDRPYAHMFGPPNDEAFHGHPLANRGLCPYAVFEVRDSSWLRRLRQRPLSHGAVLPAGRPCCPRPAGGMTAGAPR